MGDSERKYTEYRKIIDATLETAKGAQIALSAIRAGDQIKIVASAEPAEAGDGQKGDSARPKSYGQDGDRAEQNKDKSRWVLRLALTEESVHYVGGNKLRFHHHVIRALPGGPMGKELTGGAGRVELTFDLAQLKLDQEAYLTDLAKSGAFPNPLPEIKLDDLAVVAFIQDDADKSVLHAVSVPVKRADP